MNEATDGTERSLKLWVVLSRAHAAIERHAQADVARHGLTLAEFGVMEALFHGGPMTQGEVQRKTLVTSGGITYLVDRLAAKGWVERRRCDRDRRATYAALTDDGQAKMREIFPRHAEAVQHAVSGLREEDQELAIRLLRSLGRHAAELNPRGGA
ncbi:MAG TPA: MarR family winged helix-turn-helix transcriptional regulator [Longimicrobium sp.]|jgi:MarR family 2-MHQ and catechol resistance regulon transcriptional repressor|uniref:MarR family winged helix-turn-helix transcriptional regulator n=1 Tax=Longimicrobium sp. TaxID=2029185 RepID=UPI002EDB9A83